MFKSIFMFGLLFTINWAQAENKEVSFRVNQINQLNGPDTQIILKKHPALGENSGLKISFKDSVNCYEQLKSLAKDPLLSVATSKVIVCVDSSTDTVKAISTCETQSPIFNTDRNAYIFCNK